MSTRHRAVPTRLTPSCSVVVRATAPYAPLSSVNDKRNKFISCNKLLFLVSFLCRRSNWSRADPDNVNWNSCMTYDPMTVSNASSSEMQGITAWRIIKPISGTPLQGGILLMCCCNFLFGMQVVSTKELQRNLTIRGLIGRSSKGKGKGISYAQKGDWGPVHTIFLDAGSVRGRGRTRVDYEQSLVFLSPSRETRETRKWPY